MESNDTQSAQPIETIEVEDRERSAEERIAGGEQKFGEEFWKANVDQFISQTHYMLTQTHLQLAALSTVLLRRNIVTLQELQDALKEVQVQYNTSAKEQEEGSAEEGKPQQQQNANPTIDLNDIEAIDAQCAVEIEDSPDGRKPPTGHGG